MLTYLRSEVEILEKLIRLESYLCFFLLHTRTIHPRIYSLQTTTEGTFTQVTFVAEICLALTSNFSFLLSFFHAPHTHTHTPPKVSN